MSKIIRAYVTETLKDKVKKESDVLDVSESAIVKLALEQYFKNKK